MSHTLSIIGSFFRRRFRSLEIIVYTTEYVPTSWNPNAYGSMGATREFIYPTDGRFCGTPEDQGQKQKKLCFHTADLRGMLLGSMDSALPPKGRSALPLRKLSLGNERPLEKSPLIKKSNLCPELSESVVQLASLGKGKKRWDASGV